LKRLARLDFLQLLFLLLGAAVLITLPHRHQLVLATAIRSTVLLPVLRLQSGYSEMRGMRERVQMLRAAKDSLSERLLTLQNVEEENLRLRALLSLAERGDTRFVPANLYPAGRAGEVVKRSFVLDVGAADGVRRDAPVVSPEGLVGVVRVAFSRHATGDFWTHPEFRVSAMTSDGRVFGIISPLGDPPGLMRLEGAPYQLELAPGTELVTSGSGGVFPRGIPIGRVAELTGAEAGWARSYLVEPAVYPDAVREAMVLVDRDEAYDLADVWDRAASGGQN
jgi:rod shape-determining protein MreC